MSSNIPFHQKRWTILLYLGGFLLLAVLFYLAPLTHDDWYYEGGYSLSALLTTRSIGWYQTLNGRILGNALEGFTATHKLLRALIQALFVFGIWRTAASLLKLPTAGELLLMAGIVLLPSGLYAQTYGWGAGFFNYVPEMLLLLVCAWLIYRWQSGACRNKALSGMAALLCALCAQLHAENFTVISMMLGAGLIVLTIAPVLRQNRAALLSGIGFLLGGAIMFASPAYHQGYYTVSTNLMERILENYQTVSFYTLGYHVIASLLLTVSAVFLLWNREIKWSRSVKYAVTAVLVLLQLYFIGYHQILGDQLMVHSQEITDGLDFLANVVYVLLIFACTMKLPVSIERKCLTLIPLVLAVFYAGPLLVVSPIGPRCFYSTWILMLFSGASLAMEAFGEKLQLSAVKGISLCICAGVMVVCIGRNYQNHTVFVQRIQAITQGMSQHVNTIALQDYVFPEYVWGNNSQTIGEHYYYSTPHDITFTYYPYEKTK